MQFRVGLTVTEPDPGPLPTSLRPPPAWTANVKATPDRVFAFGRAVEPDTSTTPPRAPNVWTVNGRPFDHTRVIAVDMPNIDGIENINWEKYKT
jgi:hypothetical protein